MHYLKLLFTNDLGKIRPLFRVILFILMFLLINIPSQMMVQEFMEVGLFKSSIAVSLYFFSAFLSLWFQAKYIDRVQLRHFGLQINKNWINEFAYGLLIPLVQIALFCAVLYFTDNIVLKDTFVVNFENISFYEGFINEVYSLLLGASVEEIFFRAFLFFMLFEALRKVIPSPQKRALTILFLSAPIFGLAHIGNDHASTLSMINLSIDAIVICLPWVLTGRLGMSIGMHFGWNFIQGIICGFSISGNEHKVSLFLFETSNEYLSGGPFGIEGSILSLPLTVISLIIILLWKRIKSADLIHSSLVKYDEKLN